jgi:hypothetical protein
MAHQPPYFNPTLYEVQLTTFLVNSPLISRKSSSFPIPVLFSFVPFYLDPFKKLTRNNVDGSVLPVTKLKKPLVLNTVIILNYGSE